MGELAVLADTDAVAAVLSPLRRRLLQHLDTPDSATGLARRLGLSRQRVNYHLRELERLGLVELVEQRRRRGCVERIVRAKADSYLISPTLMGAPEQRDRASSAYLVAAAAKLMTDVTVLRERAERAGQPLITFTVETEVTFASPADVTAFADGLREAVSDLVESYHSTSSKGRRYRLVIGGHPVITKTGGPDGRDPQPPA